MYVAITICVGVYIYVCSHHYMYVCTKVEAAKKMEREGEEVDFKVNLLAHIT